MKMSFLHIASFCALSVAITNQAYAQFTFSFPPPLTTSTIVGNRIISDEIAEEAGRRDRLRREENNNSYTPVKPLITLADLTYTPNMQARKQNIAKFISSIRKLDPSAADSLALQVMRPSLFTEIDQLLKPKGLSVNNYADAQAVLWVSIWEGSRGLIRDTPANELQSVRNQLLHILSESAEVAALTDAQKQAAAEEAYLNAVLISASLESVQNDPEELKTYAKDIMKQYKAAGIDISNLTLTANGFVAISRP
jgi:hypothetical protein